MAWFKKARRPLASPEKTSRVPEGLWEKCPECDAIGKIKGAKCRQCGGRGWRHHGGGESITAGKPSAVKKLLRPTFAQHAEHYDQL